MPFNPPLLFLRPCSRLSTPKMHLHLVTTLFELSSAIVHLACPSCECLPNMKCMQHASFFEPLLDPADSSALLFERRKYPRFVFASFSIPVTFLKLEPVISQEDSPP
jgi:hypothetical protein